jgi:NAD(P)-dependent dehydrogenase (short-subunit alcohol dehydrogenase family)
MKYPIEGKTVLITGGAGGIGRATAKELHRRGANVVICDLNQEAVEAVVAGLGAGRALPLAADVTDLVAMEAVVDEAVGRFGGLDVVFANAGIAIDPPTTALAMSDADFDRVVEVDLHGVWRTVRAALPQIVERKGHILVTASIYAFFNGTVNIPYAMSKAAVEQLGRALRTELAGHGATAGVLYPGWVETPIAKAALHDRGPTLELVDHVYPGPLRHAITPDRVATAVADGIEQRAHRIIVPRGWIPFSLLRGLVSLATDRKLERDPAVRRLVLEIERQALERHPAAKAGA